MTEETIYQNALAHAIEQAANSQMAVRVHLDRLAFMKAERAFKESIGKEFEDEELGTVKVIAVGYKTKENVFKLDRYNSTDDAIEVKVVVAVDVKALIESKRKQLTDAERKSLKEIQSMRKDADYCRKNPWYGNYSEARNCKLETFERIDREFRDRKNALKVINIIRWSWSLSDVLNENFIKNGMNYDNQTLCPNVHD